MPFMIGKAPVRRTLKYLQDCKIIFREKVRIFSISYNLTSDHHLGARDFVFWHLPQVQYCNPSVQCIKLKNLTATPFIKIYLEDEEPVLIDLDSRTREEIKSHLLKLSIITKTEEELQEERKKGMIIQNPAHFGSGCQRHCLCEVYGQVPCSGVVPVPKCWRKMPPVERKLEMSPHILKWAKETLAKSE